MWPEHPAPVLLFELLMWPEHPDPEQHSHSDFQIPFQVHFNEPSAETAVRGSCSLRQESTNDFVGGAINRSFLARSHNLLIAKKFIKN